MPQDLPPVGGYEAVQYKRNIPIRGLQPVWYLVGAGLIMAYGWRKVFLGQREKIEMGREKMWARIHLTPLLQAEEDRDQVRRHYADLARRRSCWELRPALTIVIDSYALLLRPRRWASQRNKLAIWLKRKEDTDFALGTALSAWKD